MQLHLSDGSLVDFASDEAIPINLEDLLICLGKERRFSNKANWSVLQHSIAVGVVAEKLYEGNQPLICRAYTHDLHEAVVRDVPTPIKNAVGKAWFNVETMVQNKIEKSLDISKPSIGDEELVVAIDRAMVLVEAVHLLPDQVAEDLKERYVIDPILLVEATTAFLVVENSLEIYADEDCTELSEVVKAKFRNILQKGYI